MMCHYSLTTTTRRIFMGPNVNTDIFLDNPLDLLLRHAVLQFVQHLRVLLLDPVPHVPADQHEAGRDMAKQLPHPVAGTSDQLLRPALAQHEAGGHERGGSQLARLDTAAPLLQHNTIIKEPKFCKKLFVL